MSSFTELNEADLGTVVGGGDADPCPLSDQKFYPLQPMTDALPSF